MDKTLCLNCGDWFDPAEVIRGTCLFCSAAERLKELERKKPKVSKTKKSVELSSGDTACNLRLLKVIKKHTIGFFDLVTPSGIKILDFRITTSPKGLSISAPTILSNGTPKKTTILPKELSTELIQVVKRAIKANQKIKKDPLPTAKDNSKRFFQPSDKKRRESEYQQWKKNKFPIRNP